MQAREVRNSSLCEIRPIPGFPGYGASRDGRVWSKRKNSCKKDLMHDGWVRELSPAKHWRGYLYVSLFHVGSGRTSIKVHRAVWMAFHGEIQDGLTINHKNAVKTDNRIENLELITPAENYQHAKQLGLMKRR